MIVTLIAKERSFATSLPTKASGRYWVTDRDESGEQRQLADIEGVGGRWILHNSALLGLLDERNHELGELTLSDESRVVNAFYRDSGAAIRLLVEPSTTDRQTYSKYYVGDSCRLNIGRTTQNEIAYDNQYVSAQHACLIWEKGAWSITDTQSTNGTFVNERRVVTKRLEPGDVIYIMGLKIIAGNGFFALNNPDGQVKVSSSSTVELVPQAVEDADSAFDSEPKSEGFFRSPRIHRRIARGSIRVDAPPQPQRIEETPLALLVGPALTMGMTAAVMALVAVYNLNSGNATLVTTIPTLIMSFSMLCGTLLWPMLTRRNDKKKKLEAENKRFTRYREYLTDVKNQIFALSEEQRDILLENYPDSHECERRVLQRDRKLWERTVDQEDFLCLRLGLGDVPLDAELHFPEKRFSVDDDALQSELRRFADEPKTVRDAPVTCSLKNNPVIGVIGGAERTTAFLEGLTLQLSALHSCDEVKLVFLTGGAGEAEWAWARVLPHTYDEDSDLRLFATNADEAKTVTAALDQILAERAQAQGRQASDRLPHYVLIAPDIALAERADVFTQLFNSTGEVGISCVTTAADIMALPKECSLVVDLSGEHTLLYDRNDPTRDAVTFQAEDIGEIDMERVASVLGNLVMGVEGGSYELPSMITFLEMYGVGKVEHLNALTRWRENSPINTLQAPIGVSPDGSLQYLDLHEKAHGPHGLVAGMTGSGKSEFIITYILSMAVNYHPDEVSFILIDYKGGGLAGAFEDPSQGIRLPHLAGTITNLDGSAINRALISIQSELRRRQAVFNEARQISGEGTIDIYKYQKMYRSGLVLEPVPHLFIISDEFAELKAQQPEFMAQLISAARIGRSLGVHLILATQKPSGVVDDQIWSNSRFRVCLKVQERADSVEMLKRPDAAELKETGRFYLQVGFNELFELGQSAWCGAPYVPTDRVEKKTDDSVEVIDHLGRTLFTAQRKPKAERASKASQIVSIVRYLSELEQDETTASRRLWLPQIDALIYRDALKEKYGWTASKLALDPIIGEYDDPYNQAQGLVTIPFTREGNAIVYGMTGSGKNTLLNTLLTGLLAEYSADRLNVYIIDLGEETLRAFQDAPQVGDVLFSSDEEKIGELFKMLLSELSRRKKLLADSDGDFAAYCQNAEEPLPHILVVLRNYAAFYEQFDQVDEQLIQVTRECSKYGIYFLMTANSASAVRYRVAQNFANVYALKLNDNIDYSGLFGSTNGVCPSKNKGGGLFKNGRVYEFQTAHWAEDFGQSAVRRYAQELRAGASVFAPSVPTLPERVTTDSLPAGFFAEAVPIGVEKVSLRPTVLNLNQSVIMVAASQDPEGLGATVQGICEQLARLNAHLAIWDAGGILTALDEQNCTYRSVGFSEAVETLFSEMVRRNHVYKETTPGQKPEVFELEYYVITGLQTILNDLSDEEKDKLKTLLEKAELSYGIRFIMCGTVKEWNEFTSAAWYKRHVSGFDGVWVGDGISEQYVLKVGKINSSLYAELPPHFGYAIKHGKPTLVKWIVGRNIKEEEE